MSGNDEATTPTTEPNSATVTPADVAAAHEAMKAQSGAEDTAQEQRTDNRDEGTKSNESAESAEQTFTQADVDRIVTERLERDRAKREAQFEDAKKAQDQQIRDLTVQLQASKYSLPEDVFEGVATEDIAGFAERLGDVVAKRIAEAEASSKTGGAPHVAGVGTGETTPVETADDKALRFFKMSK